MTELISDQNSSGDAGTMDTHVMAMETLSAISMTDF